MADKNSLGLFTLGAGDGNRTRILSLGSRLAQPPHTLNVCSRAYMERRRVTPSDAGIVHDSARRARVSDGCSITNDPRRTPRRTTSRRTPDAEGEPARRTRSRARRGTDLWTTPTRHQATEGPSWRRLATNLECADCLVIVPTVRRRSPERGRWDELPAGSGRGERTEGVVGRGLLSILQRNPTSSDLVRPRPRRGRPSV